MRVDEKQPRRLTLYITHAGDGAVQLVAVKVHTADRCALTRWASPVTVEATSEQAGQRGEAAKDAMVTELKQFISVPLREGLTVVEVAAEVVSADSDAEALDAVVGCVARIVVMSAYQSIGMGVIAPLIRLLDKIVESVVDPTQAVDLEFWEQLDVKKLRSALQKRFAAMGITVDLESAADMLQDIRGAEAVDADERPATGPAATAGPALS